MKKAVLVAIVLMLFATAVSAGERMNLEFVVVGETVAEGTARIQYGFGRDGTDNTRINIRLKNLEHSHGMIYEGWLVDDESEYKLSLGALSLSSSGRGTLRVNQKMVNFGIYDRIVITKEPRYDIDPKPDGAVLMAAFPDPESKTFTIDLDGRSAVPKSDSDAEGVGEIEIDVDSNTVTFHVEFDDLEGVETKAHIHGYAQKGEVNHHHLFELELGSPKAAIWEYVEAEEPNILRGLSYFNIHSDLFPMGEIRGQIEE